ncbi:CDP-glucose 4,6-dehydratase [Bacillus sp. C1]
MTSTSFWNKKKVLITGHTGFKGTWLTLWLTSLGADVIGYSSYLPSHPCLFELSKAANECHSINGDITDYPSLLQTIIRYQPEVIFHLAAQPLVPASYKDPIETFKTNVLGTVQLFEAAKNTDSVRVIINVTSDKCYENDGSGNRSFQEEDRLGGHDPYSASKACAELVTTSYQRSFFQSNVKSAPKLASVRAGNVIGGGDWAESRLIPDIVRAFLQSDKLMIRNPNAIRPWQHVLDPLHGYLLLAEKIWNDANYAAAWNFGPINQPHLTVADLVNLTTKIWNKKLDIISPNDSLPYESPILTLNSTKSTNQLGWTPKLLTEDAISWTVEWYQKYATKEDVAIFTRKQIDVFKNL